MKQVTKNTIMFGMIIWLTIVNIAAATETENEGWAGGFFLGTGTPNSIDAMDRLSKDLDISDRDGNISIGGLGFYQGRNYRLGGLVQSQVWAGWNAGDNDADNDSVGLAATSGGFYGAYTFSKEKFLLNIGGVVGGGRVSLGYDLGDDRSDIHRHESVSALYLEPQISIGYAATNWLGIEGVIAAPMYFFNDDLTLTYNNQDYTVRGKDLYGVTCSIRFVFGNIAAL
ncbi:MAG: hypothetical protein C0403_10225 [Desulfobacterium sp.]|nr:hypothetical protein [Desulfobacterium sp.]